MSTYKRLKRRAKHSNVAYTQIPTPTNVDDDDILLALVEAGDKAFFKRQSKKQGWIKSREAFIEFLAALARVMED